jgi:ubiquinone biosynthesis protein Coq4
METIILLCGIFIGTFFLVLGLGVTIQDTRRARRYQKMVDEMKSDPQVIKLFEDLETRMNELIK